MGFEKQHHRYYLIMAYTNVLVLPVWSKEGIQANQFLIIDHERAAVIDPGGDLTYVPLTMELNKYTRLKNLDYVMASHQDPDIITSMPRWLVYTDAKVVASKLWARFYLT